MSIFLLQINGIDVRNRFQAEQLFIDGGPEITLLVSRPHNQVFLIYIIANEPRMVNFVFILLKAAIDSLDGLSVAFPFAEDEFQDEDDEEYEIESDKNKVKRVATLFGFFIAKYNFIANCLFVS